MERKERKLNVFKRAELVLLLANFNNVISEDRRNPTRAVMIISLDFQDIVKGAFFHVSLATSRNQTS